MKLKPILLIALGFACLGLGAVGVAIPVLPTTPFVLLAAACFSAGSPRLHAWLGRSRIFGPYIEHYRTGRGIQLPLKIASIATLWAGLIVSMLCIRALWAYVVLGAVGAGVTAHLLAIKTMPGAPASSLVSQEPFPAREIDELPCGREVEPRGRLM